MPYFRSIRNRRARKLVRGGFDLQLTSMLDILTIILVFMLKSQAVATTNFTSLPGMELPYSKSETIPVDSLHLIITPESMVFDDEEVLRFDVSDVEKAGSKSAYRFEKADLDEGGLRILPLYDALVRARERAEILRAKSDARDEEGNPLPFDGVLAVQADKHIHYDTLRRVMYTAASAGYRVFQLLALRHEI